MAENWKITLRVYRQKENRSRHTLTISTWKSTRTSTCSTLSSGPGLSMTARSAFRHACHHSTCGACGMRVNGVEKLTCITLIRDVTHDGATLKVEPLRNFPVVSDLAVDMGLFYRKMEEVGARAVLPVTEAEIEKPPSKWDAGRCTIYPSERLPGMRAVHQCLPDNGDHAGVSGSSTIGSRPG